MTTTGAGVLVLGVDPGLNGAFALIGPGTRVAFRVPTYERRPGRKELNVLRLRDAIDTYPRADVAVIEEVNGDPDFGGAVSFTFGKTFGQLLAFLQLREYPLVRVRPQRWKKVVLGGASGKQAAIDFVAAKYPDINLKPPRARIPSHDLAEAVCLAEYGHIATGGAS